MGFAVRIGLVVVASVLVIACGEDSATDTCGLLRSSSSDGLGCETAILDLSPHPCTLEVEAVCGDDSDCAGPELATCATEYYLRSYEDDSLPACDPDRPLLTIDQRLRLSLFRGIRISDGDAAVHTNGLQHYFAPHELWMNTDGIAATDPIRYAMAGTAGQFDAALNDAGIAATADPDALTAEEEQAVFEAISSVMFAPTREFLAAYAQPMQSKVNVVVIDQILSPSLVEILELEGTVVGLGLSAALLERVNETAEDSDVGSLNTMLDIEGDFTPTLFVSHTDIARLTADFDMVIAHEMGHALGLPHVEDVGNLMEQGGDDSCRRWLSQEQIDLMGPFAQATNAPDDALSRILGARRNLVRRVLEQRWRWGGSELGF